MTPFFDAIAPLAWTQIWQVTIVIVVIGLLTWLFCRRRPHLAHMLWMIVLFKCVTPPIWSSPTGVFCWPTQRPTASAVTKVEAAPRPAAELRSISVEKETRSELKIEHRSVPGPDRVLRPDPIAEVPDVETGPPRTSVTTVMTLIVIWLAGVAVCVGLVVVATATVVRNTRGSRSPLEEPLRVMLDDLRRRLGIRRRVQLVIVREPIGPMTFGWIRPNVILPSALAEDRSLDELEPLLAHELVHVRRGDTLVGFLQIVAGCVWWFHPLVWWANRRIVTERERCCDEEVVAGLAFQPGSYARCLVSVLELKRQLRWLPALPGIRSFEVTKQRLEYLVQHSSSFRARMPRIYWLALLVGLFVVVPGAGLVGVEYRSTSTESGLLQQDGTVNNNRRSDPSIRNVNGKDKPDTKRLALRDDGRQERASERTDTVGSGSPTRTEEKTRFPRIVETVPKSSVTGVDPDLTEVRVTFDRDMQKGMSWTGGPPLFPPVDKSRKMRWVNARTCVLPVKLAKGSYYRLGINSMSYQNFRSRDGVAARPSAIYFTTRGASDEIESRVRKPRIVSIEPANGATDVDPSTSELRVTFDRAMGKGMSWTGSGPLFPTSPAGKKAVWVDERTCMLPVTLEPGHEYRLGFNSPSHINFQTEWGVPLEPVVYKFSTRRAEK